MSSVPYLSPEVRPSIGENTPVIEPNLAQDNPELCKAIAKYIGIQFFIPYLTQAERLYPQWDRNDDMWRVRVQVSNLDLYAGDMLKAQSGKDEVDGKGKGFRNKHDPVGAKVTPATVHKQMDAIINVGVDLSFKNGEIPVKAQKPKHVYEHPLYNPTQQSIDAANEELRRQAEEIDLKTKYRMSFGTEVINGHCGALVDFHRELEDIVEDYPLPPDQGLAQAFLAQKTQELGGKMPEIIANPDGTAIARCVKRVIKVQHTDLVPLDRSALFIDDLMSRDMNKQPCPIVRQHVNRWELEDNRYDPELNPFGWFNIEEAIEENSQHYALSSPDESDLMRRLIKRWGMGETLGGQSAKNTIKQLWTCYPKLAISPDGRLDEGNGLECLHCKGKGMMDTMIVDPLTAQESVIQGICPECQGQGKIRVKSERYVIQFLGTMYNSYTMTALRIQRNPTVKDKVPILFSCHLVEDMSTARPVSKSEMVTSAMEVLTTAYNQFIDAKNLAIRRGWKVRMDSPAWGMEFNVPNVVIPWESTADEATRVESNSFDETETLIPFIQMVEPEPENIFGANPTVLGQISSGRRSSSEINLASSASIRPLTNWVDSFNGNIIKGWAQFALDNLEHWNDSDWLRKRTGRTTWGKMELRAASGEEFVKKMEMVDGYRYVLELAGGVPALQPAVPEIVSKLLPIMGLEIDPGILDQGLAASRYEAMQIVQAIMGNGDMSKLMPQETDPNAIYAEVFTQAIRQAENNPEDMWFENRQYLPLLKQRNFFQQQALAMQQMLQQQQMLAMQAQESMAQNAGDPRANQPPRPKQSGGTPGEKVQRNQ